MPPPLLPLFRSNAQARLLTRIFLEGEPSGVPLGRLAAETAIAPATAHREIGRLEEAGLVQSARVGRERRIAANRASPFYPELDRLLLKAFGPAAELAEALDGVDAVDAAYVFGSWARRYRGEPGPYPQDIDLLVVGQPNPDDVYAACRRVEERIGFPIDVTILSPDEWLRPDSGFVRSLRTQPLVPLVE